MVVEQLIIPKQFGDLPVGEFDIDLVVWDGQLKYGAVTDNWKPIPPYYLEVRVCVRKLTLCPHLAKVHPRQPLPFDPSVIRSPA